MAGNNAIQILRANSATIASSSETLLDGQLLYNTDKNYLTCGGGGNNKPVDSLPIVCQELAYYQGDANTISANTGNNNLVYRIGPNKLVDRLEIESKGNMSINSSSLIALTSSNTNITAYGKINIYGDEGVSVNANGVVNINSAYNLNMFTPNSITINGGTGVHLASSNYVDITNYSAGTCGISISSVFSNVNISTSTNDISISASRNLYLNGSNIQCNATQGMNVRIGSNTINFPTKSGTIALTSDISGASPTVTQNSDGTVDVTFN